MCACDSEAASTSACSCRLPFHADALVNKEQHARTQVASELQPPPPKGWKPRPRSKNAPKPAALVSYGDNDGEVSSCACSRFLPHVLGRSQHSVLISLATCCFLCLQSTVYAHTCAYVHTQTRTCTHIHARIGTPQHDGQHRLRRSDHGRTHPPKRREHEAVRVSGKVSSHLPAGCQRPGVRVAAAYRCAREGLCIACLYYVCGV